ncbi:MAG TPA: hypothetical protein VH391_09515 [Solirubrobacterales bacterium]|jgi:hypothetical protein
MASRKDEREQRRAARREAEEREAAAAKRRQLVGYGVAGLLTLAVVIGIVVVIASGGSDSSSSASTNPNSVPAAAEVGVQTTPPPWDPEYDHLAERLQALGLPGLNEQIFHIHSFLHVYVNGKPVTVPANIGLKEPTGPFSPIHTHDTSGIVHMEADQEYPFTIGQFFAVWGVRFSNDQLGPYEQKGDDKLSVYVNGKKVGDPVNYVMKDHDNISVGYGKPGSFPTKPAANFPAGL